LSAWPSNAATALCAAEIKPSKACRACSTPFSANARISGGISKRSVAILNLLWWPQQRPAMLVAAPPKVVRPAAGLTPEPANRPNGSARQADRRCGQNPLRECSVTGMKAQMRIVDIRECAIPLKSSISNSSFDFSEMTTSVVAVLTDVMRDGAPVVGSAFNSTGRYACGAAMRARFIPRILGAEPPALLDAAQDNFDPERILGVMMQREK